MFPKMTGICVDLATFGGALCLVTFTILQMLCKFPKHILWKPACKMKLEELQFDSSAEIALQFLGKGHWKSMEGINSDVLFKDKLIWSYHLHCEDCSGDLSVSVAFLAFCSLVPRRSETSPWAFVTVDFFVWLKNKTTTTKLSKGWICGGICNSLIFTALHWHRAV